MSAHLLLVDDDVRFREFLGRYLEHRGFSVEHAVDGSAALAAAERRRPDLVILDVMMPGLDGHAVLRALREVATSPVIFLTAKGDEGDRVRGLDLGADDYVAKPCSTRELVSRIHAVLRRAQPIVNEVLRFGDLAIDVERRQVQKGNTPIELTATELDLLLALVRGRGRPQPRDQLRQLAGRGDVAVDPRNLDVHVHRLRKKLCLEWPGPRIETVRGVGYVFLLPEQKL